MKPRKPLFAPVILGLVFAAMLARPTLAGIDWRKVQPIERTPPKVTGWINDAICWMHLEPWCIPPIIEPPRLDPKPKKASPPKQLEPDVPNGEPAR